MLLKRLDNDNKMNFPVHHNETFDSIGLGMSKSKMLKFNLGRIDLHGIVCSGNNMPGFTKPYAIAIDCDSVISANPKFDCEFGKKFIVTCPANCYK
jgi:hypothetical protein